MIEIKNYRRQLLSTETEEEKDEGVILNVWDKLPDQVHLECLLRSKET